MLNLRTKGLNDAAAVLGGYDAMVHAGLQVETGKPNAVPAPAPEAKKVQPAPAVKESQPSPATTTTQPRQAKRHKAKTKH